MKELLISCTQNYRNCLKQLFTVLGILFLSILLGCSALYTQSAASFVQLKENVLRDYNEADLKLSYLTGAVKERIEDFGIGDLISIIEKKSLLPVLEGRIERALYLTIDNYMAFAEKLETDVEICALGLCLAVAFLALILAAGMIVGFFTAEIIARRKMSRTKVTLILKEMLIRFLGFVLAVAAMFGLYQLFPEHWNVFLCILPFLVIFMALLSSWVAVRKQGIRFRNLLTWQNYFGLLLADVGMLAVSLLLGWVLFKIFNIVVAFAVAAAFVIITLAALDLSAASCVEEAKKKLAAAGEQPEAAGAEPSAVPEAAEVKCVGAAETKCVEAAEAKSAGEAGAECAKAAEEKCADAAETKCVEPAETAETVPTGDTGRKTGTAEEAEEVKSL